MKNFVLLVIAVMGLTIITACEKEKENDNGNELPKETLILNNWIWEGMNEVYLWEAYIPDINWRAEPDPEAFFYKLLFSQDIQNTSLYNTIIN